MPKPHCPRTLGHPRPRPLLRLLLTAVATIVTALALTACEDGQGLRDEGPSTAGLPAASTPPLPAEH